MPPCLNFRLLDEMKTRSSHTSYFVYCTFMTSWCLTSWVPRVRSGYVRHADFSWFSHTCFGLVFHIFPSCSFFFVLLPCSVGILGFVSPLSFLFHFFCEHRVFCIHVLLSFLKQLHDCFWWNFSDWEEEIPGQQPCLESC